MTNICLRSENIDHQLSNALSTMFLRRLDIFLHFETYVFQNPQNPYFCHFPIYQLDFLPHIYEAGSQVGICENQWTTLFEDFGTHMSQSLEKYLDVVGTLLIVR